MVVDLIVSRHYGHIVWMANEICPEGLTPRVTADCVEFLDDGNTVRQTIPIRATATEEHVEGKTVFGDIPFHLAALCDKVGVIHFKGRKTVCKFPTDIERAGPVLRWWTVREYVADGE